MRLNSHKKILFILAFMIFWAGAQHAFAQITPTARVDLNAASKEIFIGENIYLTPDPDGRLNAEIIAMRHQNNLRGTRHENAIVNFDSGVPRTWMVFTATNKTDKSDWILHFGDIMDGRMGLAQTIEVSDITDGKINPPILGRTNMSGGAMPLKIAPGKTHVFAVLMESQNGLPFAIAPKLMTENAYMDSINRGGFLNSAMIVFLIGAVAGFLTLAALWREKSFVFLGVHFFIWLVLFYFLNIFFAPGFSMTAGIIGLLPCAAALCSLLAMRDGLSTPITDPRWNLILIGMAILVVACGVFSLFLPLDALKGGLAMAGAWAGYIAMTVCAISFARKGSSAAMFFAFGWLIIALGFLTSILFFAGILGEGPFCANALWFTLWPGAGFLFYGTYERIKALQTEERALMARENRAQRSLERLRQSRESADQARLLRVIERERELMAELRERERQRTDEMRKAKDMADHANQAKSAFLAVVSHEIRTPMTGILGLVRLLKGTKLAKEQSDYLMTIQQSGEAMMALLNDILDFEKIEAGNMRLEIIDFDMARLVQGVVTLMLGHATGKNTELKAEIDESFPRSLMGDPTRLRQILLNLVNNAIKFTDRGRVTIRLRAYRAQGTGKNPEYDIYCAVEDTGIGISEEAQARLFKPFEQAGASTTRKYGGTGLGLAISQKLIEAMGSKIRVESVEGQGTTFHFTIRLKQGTATIQETAPAQPEHITVNTARVLVVEDNEINRRVVVEFLEKSGHVAIPASTGEEAVALSEAAEFTLVLMDINLGGGMNGIQTAKKIRSLPDKSRARMPLVALTGDVGAADVKNILASGFDGHLPKPVDFDRLLKMIADIQAHIKKISEKNEIVDAPKVEPKTQTVSETAKNPAPVIDPGIFDVKMMDGLLKSLGRDAMIDLMKGLIEKSDEITAALVALKNSGDLLVIRDRAHELKGMAGNFGIKEIAAIAKRIEDSGKNNDRTSADTAIGEIADANDRAKSAIKSWLGI